MSTMDLPHTAKLTLSRRDIEEAVLKLPLLRGHPCDMGTSAGWVAKAKNLGHLDSIEFADVVNLSDISVCGGSCCIRLDIPQ